MDYKNRLRTVRWLLVLGCPLLCVSFFLTQQAACILEELPLDRHRCLPEQGVFKCLEGWECDTSRNPPQCVKAGTLEQAVELTPEESAPVEVTPEEAMMPEEMIPPEEAGVEKIPEPQPEQPVLQCNYNKAPEVLTCPVAAGIGCERFGDIFVASTDELPKAMVGAAAISNGFRRRVDQDQSVQKVFIYLLGGSSTGDAGTESYVTEVNTQNKHGAWQAGPALVTARTGASAFLIDGAVYLVGGKGADGKIVTAIERAAVKNDGSLDAFRVIGTWSSLRMEAGIAYQYGYFYQAGGLSAAGTPSAEAERILLKPDQTLGDTEPLSPLPSAQVGALLSTHHFLYFLSKTNQKSYVAKVTPNADAEGWCETTALPTSVKDFQAVADAQRLFLFGVKNNADQLDGQLYFAPVQASTGDKDPYGGSLESWLCSNHGTLQVTQVTPRAGAAAVIARSGFFLIGGKDKDGNALKSIESAPLQFRLDPQCDLDRDGVASTFDFCPDTYDKGNKNSDQPDTIRRPGQDGWIERFGLGDACEYDQMRLVPAGFFKRGSAQNPDEQPIEDIRLDAYYIDPFEVRIRDYKECVRLGKCTEPKEKSAGSIADYYDNEQFADHPVIHVTWEQASAYCVFRGKRLPTEAEWEKAARGLDQRSYPWGSDSPDCQKANSQNCPEKNTLAVTEIPGGVSPYQVFQMAGNVREWVSDFYAADSYATGSKSNPRGPASGQKRVIRGGSFLSAESALSSTRRDSGEPTESAADLGFRCARSLFLAP